MMLLPDAEIYIFRVQLLAVSCVLDPVLLTVFEFKKLKSQKENVIIFYHAVDVRLKGSKKSRKMCLLFIEK